MQPEIEHVQLATSAPQEAVLLSTSDKTLFLAGIGSGKSHNIALSSADFAINHPDIIQFVGANTYKQLTLSTLKRVFDTWLSVFDWKKGRDFVVGTIPPNHWPMYGAPLKSYDSVITFENGHQIVTGSLDNYKALDGQEFGVAHLDETKDTKEEAVSEVILTRLRQPGLWLDDDGQLYGSPEHDALLAAKDWQYSTTADGERQLTAADGRNVRSWNPLFIYTSPAKVDWINLMFNLTSEYEEISRRIFSKTDFYHKANREQCVVISSTYHNQDNLPVGFIQKKERDYAGNPSRRDMLIYGSPIAKSGGEFLPQFERLRHVKKGLGLLPGHTAHITLDFNVVPYMTMLAAQLIEAPGGRLTLRFFAEYALESPSNNTAAICRAFIADYGSELDNGLFYYGDPAGRARQTVTTEFKNNYSVVAKEFAPYIGNYSDRVQNVAPGIIDRRDFIGALFEGTLGIDIEIDDQLTHFIHDLEYCKEDASGKMLKPKYKDPTTKMTYERYGHHLDASAYLICSLLKQQYDTFRQRR